jgi:hypothetical protein
MASYAPMPYSPYSPPMAYSPPMPYSPPMAYSPPVPQSPSMSYADTPQSAPIPLTPLVVHGEDPSDPSTGGGGGGGGMVTKFLALPLIIVLPILLPIVVLVLRIGLGLGLGLGKKPVAGTGGNENVDTTPYYDESSYGNDYQDNYNGQPDNQKNRKRRQAQKNKEVSSSTALPSMSIAQVDRLTQVIFEAMNSQECVQRLLCEVGSLSRSFSGSSETVTKAVKDYVPEKLKDSFNIFAKAEKCEQYRCGSLNVKN